MTHTCHASGCEIPVPPKMFMCRSHWYKLPKEMRDWIWVLYRPGQEITKDPSEGYLFAAQECISYLERLEAS